MSWFKDKIAKDPTFEGVCPSCAVTFLSDKSGQGECKNGDRHKCIEAFIYNTAKYYGVKSIQ